MAAKPDPVADLKRSFEIGVDGLIDTLINKSRDIWKAQAEDARQYLDAISRYEELIRTEHANLVPTLVAADHAETKALELLINAHGAARVMPRWEAAGDLAPPSFRQALLETNIGWPLPGSPAHELGRAPDAPDRSSAERKGSAVALSRLPQPEKRVQPDTNETGWESPGRSKRTRRCRSGCTSAEGNEPATIPFYEVEGRHWSFQYPRVGDGHFVLLCNADPSAAHRFDDDPFTAHRAIRHFEAKDKKCHKDGEGLPAKLTELEVVQKYGYQVEGITDQSCKDSNQRISDERDVRRAHFAKASRKAADEAPHYATSDAAKTNPSRPLGRPEVQPIDRPVRRPCNTARIEWSAADDLSPVRSDLV